MNKVMLIGNVGKEPDVRYYDADQAVAQVTVGNNGEGLYLGQWYCRYQIIPIGITSCSYRGSCKDSGEVCSQGRQTLCGRKDPLSTL